jgi:tRNA(Ile)-lysidine synthase
MARELRYRFLLATARRAGCDRIATGHTMTDQAETFLMRLARGASLRGLSSMRPVIAVHSFGEGEEGEELPPASGGAARPLLIRPLLAITREEVEAYIRDRGLDYRVDATNEELHYTRNRIRSRVLPALAEINPQIVETLARTAEIAASDQDALDEIVFSALEEARVESGPDHTRAAYSARALAEQPLAVRRRMMVEALRRLRASQIEARPSSDQITSKHVAAMVALLDAAGSGKRVELPGRVEVWREFDRIVFKQGGERPYVLELSRNRPALKAGGLEITLTRGMAASELRGLLEEASRERVRTGMDWMIVVLDDRLLPEKLAVRPRRAGERAKIMGRRRTKKLKNLMIDHKIPSSRRNIWPVVATPDGLYIWSPGLPPAQEFAARDETQGLAILRASYI